MKLTGVGQGAPITLLMGCMGKTNAMGRLDADRD
jgi:hypothetical protein